MRTILVVDDSEFMRLRCRQLLSSQGYRVEEAANGQEAVDKYVALHPDLVLMDITMPVMDGISALRAIRASDPHARIVMCTALGQQAMVLEAIKAGAKDYIVKPFQPDRVLAAVQRLVGEENAS